MALAKVDIRTTEEPLPPMVVSLLAEAEKRIDDFQLDGRVPGFVPSHAAEVYRVLKALVTSHLLPGNRFCEWGSGFGVVTNLASIVGLDACGLEIDQPLVDAARRLAADFDRPVEYFQGSFIPPGGESFFTNPNAIGNDGISWIVTDGNHELDELGLAPDEFDLIFVYPWPDEEQAICRMFDRFASVGTVLALHHANGEISLFRKRK